MDPDTGKISFLLVILVEFGSGSVQMIEYGKDHDFSTSSLTETALNNTPQITPHTAKINH